MSIMAKTPSGYKKIGFVYLGERPVDKVFNANGDVVYALQRELTGVPPLLFKGKEQSELSNYRIYGDTIDGESVGDRTENLCNIIVYNGIVKDALYLTVNDDKSITLNGYANSTAVIHISDFISAGNYYIKGCPAEGSSSSFQIVARDRNNSNIVAENGDGVQFNATSDFDICIRIAANYNCDGLTFFPIVSLNESPYEPYGYKVPVTVEGKNLFDGEFEQGNAYSMSINNRVRSVHVIPVYSGKSYTLSCNMPLVYKFVLGSSPNNIYPFTIENSTYCGNSSFWSDGGLSFTCIKSGYISVVMSLIGDGSISPVDIPDTLRVQFEEGLIATPYEPYHAPVTVPIYLPEPIKMVGDEAEYVDYSEQKQYRVRKNLLSNIATSQTTNGVTFTMNEDGSITCDGMASANAQLIISARMHISAGSYILSGCPTGGATSTYELDIFGVSDYYANGIICRGVPAKFSFPVATQTAYVSITIRKGYTCDNLTFYPMIRSADIEDDTYEPYIENTEVDVTLPTLPVMPGTNTMSVDAVVQPSRMDIKGRIKSLT